MTTETLTPFTRYPHLERWGHTKVRGLEEGMLYVFPKLDGTNACVWWDGETVAAGSRNRKLSLDKDNAGFLAYVESDLPHPVRLRRLAEANPDLIFYGEWLVPHTFKMYRDECWRRFYIFDVYDRKTCRFLTYEVYQEMLENYELDYIPAMARGVNLGVDRLTEMMETHSVFCVQDGKGGGEGIVIKNYEWLSRYEGQPWAKMVRNAFKEKHVSQSPTRDATDHADITLLMVEDSLTEAEVRKMWSKVLLLVQNDAVAAKDPKMTWSMKDPDAQQLTLETFKSRCIPRFLNMLYSDFISEHLADALKKYKDPTINFKDLRRLACWQAKKILTEVF